MKLVFHWTDWAFLLLICWFLFKGFKNGLLKVFFDFFRMAIVLVCCLGYFIPLSLFIQNNTLIPQAYSKLASFGLIAAGAYFAVSLVSKLLSLLVNINFTSWLDRAGGMLMGVGHYTISLTFAILLVMLLPLTYPHEQVYEKSYLGKRLVKRVVGRTHALIRWLPGKTAAPSMSHFSKTSLSASLTK